MKTTNELLQDILDQQNKFLAHLRDSINSQLDTTTDNTAVINQLNELKTTSNMLVEQLETSVVKEDVHTSVNLLPRYSTTITSESKSQHRKDRLDMLERKIKSTYNTNSPLQPLPYKYSTQHNVSEYKSSIKPIIRKHGYMG